MLAALLIATTVHWVTLPNDKVPNGYVGWRLDEKQIVALDSRLQLPEGAYPRDEYVRYYSGEIAPDGKKTLKVALVREGHLMAKDRRAGIWSYLGSTWRRRCAFSRPSL